MSRSKKPTAKKGGRRPKLDGELVAAAIVRHAGNLASVAKQFKVVRSSVVEFIAARPMLQQVLSDAREGMKDDAESALHKAIKKGEGWAVCFYLKTQAKDRGYVEKQELDVNSRNRLVIEEEIVGPDDRQEGPPPPQAGGVPG